MKIERPVSILILLTGLNFLHYVDRFIVAAVSPSFQRDLQLSNFQTGLVMSAFMVGYFVTSPFFGHFGDRSLASGQSLRRPTRTWLIAGGVAVWSAATALSGVASGASSLIAARIVVGVGEASYATLAPTLIDDLAPAQSKNRWLAVFYMATPVGSALGYLLGGLFEKQFGWRGAFFVAGGPGVLLALLVFLIVEPTRPPQPAQPPSPTAPSVRASVRTLIRKSVYVAAVAGSIAYTFALGGFAAWAPKFLCKAHGMTLANADFLFGAVAVVSGIIGTIVGGTLADRSLPKDASSSVRLRRYLRFSAIATMLAVPAGVAALLARNPTEFFVATFVCELALFASTSPMNAVVLGSVPVHLRASAMALNIFAIHALGDFISPPAIGLLADYAALRTALAMVPIAIAIAAWLWWRGTTRQNVNYATDESAC